MFLKTPKSVYHMVLYSAPGKLFLSGEWAVLEGFPGLVAAVNTRVQVTAKAHAGDHIIVSAPDMGIPEAAARFDNDQLVFEGLDEKQEKALALVGQAIIIALRFAQEKNIPLTSFSLLTQSGDFQTIVDGEKKKVGFGSSAAVVVATVAAVLDVLGYRATRDETYKLAAIAHYVAQGKAGSGFDIAASTYGGVFVYKRFDGAWLTQQMTRGTALADIVASTWPHFVVEKLTIPKDLHLLVGWTRSSASTTAMIGQMNAFKTGQRGHYDELFANNGASAGGVIAAWKENDKTKILEGLKKNARNLQELTDASNVTITTPELATLAAIADDNGGAGKLSGAGGGDCGIAVCYDDGVAGTIKEKWRAAGIAVLDVAVDKEGLRREA